MTRMLVIAGIILALLPAGRPAADEYPFGRIFTSEEERDQLDRLAVEQPAVDLLMPRRDESEVSPEMPPPERIVYSGALMTGQGNTVSWVDGQSELSAGTGSRPAHTPPRQDDRSASARFHLDGRETTLKPGQTWIPADNRVLEPWESAHEPPVAGAPDAGPSGAEPL